MRYVVLAMLVARVASADVAGDVGAGGGNETAAPDGYASATATFIASLERHEAPLAGRAINARDDKTGEPICCVWLLTGIDPDERMGVGAQGSGEMRASNDGSIGLASGAAWARAYGWGVTVGGDVQPIGDLRDRFWRSGRDVVAWHTSFDIPPLWAIGTPTTQVMVIPFEVTVGRRIAAIDGNWYPAGWDRAVDTTVVRLQRPHLNLDVLAFHYAEWGVAVAHLHGIEYGTSATTIDFDAFDSTWRLDDRLAVHARFGISSRMPVSAYALQGTAENSIGSEGDAADYWLQIDDGNASFDMGSWARLDPTGFAADAGQLVTGSLARRIAGIDFTGKLEVGRLRRLAISDYAPPGLAPVGTRMWVGRAEIDARYKLAHRLELDGAAYVERSDRDDPRWIAAADGRLDTHAGVDLTAHWRSRR
jgi:hypothetical protein